MYFKDINSDHELLEIRKHHIEKDISWVTDALKECEYLDGIGACK